MPDNLPAPIVIPCAAGALQGLLSKEWLLTNKLGSYASSTPLGCNTRRYHGLLVASTLPPVKRINMLSSIMEQLIVSEQTFDLATNEFAGSFSPNGRQYLVEFRNDVAPTFIFRAGNVELKKEIMLAENSNILSVRYTLTGGSARLVLWPFAALRDFHGLRKVHEPHQLTFETLPEGVVIQDRMWVGNVLNVVGRGGQFQARPQWWYHFLYRQDISRGQDGYEDIYTPGSFMFELEDGQTCQLVASMDHPQPFDFDSALASRRERLCRLADSAGPDADEFTRRLAVATEPYTVMRSFPNAPPSPTILAGYHWFADWGRDAFIALPGLLLCTKNFDLAKGVFQTFASHVKDGMIPNVFDDYSPSAHYNSIDAPLWFIIAGERYLQATGDLKFWRSTLMPAANVILSSFANGTMFDIHADSDGLLTGGSMQTQLTWMDVKLGDNVITPRQGKAVEINALWYNAHRIMAQRCSDFNPSLADHFDHLAQMIAPAFVKTFWNEQLGWLNDCVHDGQVDASLRPNQIFAVSLPHCPLSPQQQVSVVRHVKDNLLTPLGLRTLSPHDSRYRRRYGGSWESRDRAYHQGTVWAWLMGPFVEAYLKVEQYKPFAVAQARQWLDAFDVHMREAGLGQISEIFDGDAPHHPGGCIAQAWSVSEILRVKILIDEKQAKI